MRTKLVNKYFIFYFPQLKINWIKFMVRIADFNLVETTFAACSTTPKKSVACFLVLHLICLTPAMFSAYTGTRCAWACCCHSAITVLCTLTTDHTQEGAERKRQRRERERERDPTETTRLSAWQNEDQRSRLANFIQQICGITKAHTHITHTGTPINKQTHQACLSCYYLKI